jgi:cation diffusion facilitator CzcD-associated flavoprotein CzcO/acetyl esterase/lipase
MAGDGATNGDQAASEFDVVVVGAGMAGLYMLHRLRGLGFSAVVLESADDVGGTWYWNRYPGARCDIESLDYSYSFDRELEAEWQWSERYATQPEILRYLGHVADRYDLRRDIRFSTLVDRAEWDDATTRWHIHTSGGDELVCQFYVMATGCLSLPKDPDIPGYGRFQGEVYFTGRWPHEGVDFTGKRVAVIGTGSSGIQSIPLIAEQASALTVFQRTPNFAIPAWNGPVRTEHRTLVDGDRDAYRAAARNSPTGVPLDPPVESALMVSEDERRRRYEAGWQSGLLTGNGHIGSMFNDIIVNPAANDTVSEFVREKIRSIVQDPEVAETLCPKDYPMFTKRVCLYTDDYDTFNEPHVRLVDLRKHAIATITEQGIDTVDESFQFDAIVFAIGFDAMTGALVSVDIRGRDGQTLAQKWDHGPQTYLGLTTVGFPNFFMITGPGSPSVLSNMVVSIEQHVDWIAECLENMRTDGFDVIEPTSTAEAGWVQHVNDYGDITLFPRANSWYMGANVPGKPRVFLPYVGGVDRYRVTCDEVVARDYLGFMRSGPAGERCHDGQVRRVQPDVALVLELLEQLGLPPLESMSTDDARAFVAAMNTQRPPGPDVGEIVDGKLPGADGALNYRLYRPDTPGPHPIVVYFHGGGWVLGDTTSDDPLCRDLCVRCDAVVVSADYRHGPESRFPAAVDDAWAAVRWVAANAEMLGGRADHLGVAGWSAGGNLAAVVSQLARDAGGPSITALLLLTPVTDSDFGRLSYRENAEGYVLTAGLMHWFWDRYADEGDRTDPRVTPLHGDLSNLPPAVVVTCDFDPLRDEGEAYAKALAGAGNEVHRIRGRGHTHTSLTMVDVVVSGAPVRAAMTQQFRELLGSPVPA